MILSLFSLAQEHAEREREKSGLKGRARRAGKDTRHGQAKKIILAIGKQRNEKPQHVTDLHSFIFLAPTK